MPISDKLVDALHMRLAVRSDADFDVAAGELVAMLKDGDIGGLGELTYAAFTCAARRRWAQGWTWTDLVQFVADFRSSSDEAASMLSASAGENQLRMALGDTEAPYPDMEARGRAQFLLLTILTANYSPEELDSLLSEARGLAEPLIG